MTTALITTTINIPRVLALYRQYGPHVSLFVVGDRKTDDIGVINFLDMLEGQHFYYGIDWQHKLYPELSRLIGENCIQRRNIATLEAVKFGASTIISIDDDNVCLNKYYFDDMGQGLTEPFDGLRVGPHTEWFDVGALLNPKAPHRGMPIGEIADPVFEAVVGAKVGVCAGICMGDPDISAVTRIANGPIVHNTSVILQHGVVVDPKVKTVFNSQNTGFIRELAPAFFMFPGCGRYDDIYASLVMQRVMRERDLHVRFGAPFVWQQRNQHDLTKDLLGEIEGMRDIRKVSDRIDQTVLKAEGSVIEHTRQIFEAIEPLLPKIATDAGVAFLDDMEVVLS